MPDYTMRNFHSNGQYEDAIAYASDPDIRAGFTDWDYLFLSLCLYKLKRYSEYLELYKEFHAKFPESDLLNDNMGWSLYYLHIRNFDYENGDRRRFLKQIDYILEHCTDSQYSPKNRVVTVVTDAIFKGRLSANPDYELGNKYLSMIDPLTLDLTEHENNVEGKIRKSASDREKWYNRKTKALVELKRYEECLSCIEDAFENIDHFHNNCDQWLNYRKAQSLFGLGDIDGAEKTINSILIHFEHWCFYENLFDIAALRGDRDAAIRFGSLCSVFDWEHEHRVSFYVKYAEYLRQNGFPREAAMLYKLVELIREENNWKEIRLPDDFSYPENVRAMNKSEVLKELNSFWRKERERGIDFFEGKIERILPNGKHGFIRDDNGKSYHFNARDFTSKVRELQEGKRVRYTLAERFDKSKNQTSLNAVQISFIR